MLVLFEVHVPTGAEITELLSPEVLEETQAQIMTREQARAVGFKGAEALSSDDDLYLVAVAPRDARFIASRLEASHLVIRFGAHEVEA